MMARCGLASNGAPEFDATGQLIWPLHGRIANLPASKLSVEIDEAVGQITVRGTVVENRFHFRRLQLETTISMRLDSNEISIADRVTNLSDRTDSIQMLYQFWLPSFGKRESLFCSGKKTRSPKSPCRIRAEPMGPIWCPRSRICRASLFHGTRSRHRTRIPRHA